jgi:hypothetical protein
MPVRGSQEILPELGDIDDEALERLNQIVDVDQMYNAIKDNWLGKDRQKGPEEWPQMKFDDALLAEFWYGYNKWKKGD